MDKIALKQQRALQRKEESEILQRTALRMAGFTADDLVLAMEKTRAALNANQVKVFNHEGRLIYSDPLVDHAIRLEAADRMMRMVPGMYAPKQEEQAQGSLTVEVITMAPDGTRLAVQVKA